jgi:transposase
VTKRGRPRKPKLPPRPQGPTCQATEPTAVSLFARLLRDACATIAGLRG